MISLRQIFSDIEDQMHSLIISPQEDGRWHYSDCSEEWQAGGSQRGSVSRISELSMTNDQITVMDGVYSLWISVGD